MIAHWPGCPSDLVTSKLEKKWLPEERNIGEKKTNNFVESTTTIINLVKTSWYRSIIQKNDDG